MRRKKKSNSEDQRARKPKGLGVLMAGVCDAGRKLGGCGSISPGPIFRVVGQCSWLNLLFCASSNPKSSDEPAGLWKLLINPRWLVVDGKRPQFHRHGGPGNRSAAATRKERQQNTKVPRARASKPRQQSRISSRKTPRCDAPWLLMRQAIQRRANW